MFCFTQEERERESVSRTGNYYFGRNITERERKVTEFLLFFFWFLSTRERERRHFTRYRHVCQRRFLSFTI
jgi:hypothetical protein